jgi:hypothetical protein
LYYASIRTCRVDANLIWRGGSWGFAFALTPGYYILSLSGTFGILMACLPRALYRDLEDILTGIDNFGKFSVEQIEH